ncbi:MAG: CehA/McbA family metallohydrolase [Planctomycetes bacterium]|nr:CehA/McbA family metallohydrolase [Planctomycetota bacterium]
MNCHLRRLAGLVLVSIVWYMSHHQAIAHDHTLQAFLKYQREVALQNPDIDQRQPKSPHCHLTIEIVDAETKAPLPGLLRVTDTATNTRVKFAGLIARDNQWHTMPSRAVVDVPQSKLRIEALHGLEFEIVKHDVDLSGKHKATIQLALTRFYDAKAEGLRNGNTHLHLMKRTYGEALRYLREVPKGDGLDLVFLSHLRRIPDERHYISNKIVEGSLPGGELKRLSQHGVLFSPGEEHRHNFGRGGEGYGHVMLLDIAKLIRPVSIGPGIMRSGNDGMTLRRGIKEARKDGATIIWCHNTFGFEGIPNWMAGLLDAQNIYDGGNHGSYKDTFYRYLNLGMHVPFSTGTDWDIYDFSRVYVPIAGELTSAKWLSQLAAGRTFITNGPILEFQVGTNQIGDTIKLPESLAVDVHARAVGRSDFMQIELVYNGDVIFQKASRPDAGHFVASINRKLQVPASGWLALRVTLSAGKNAFNRTLFAHTSPVYFELAGQRIFRAGVARGLIADIEQGMETITSKGKFDNDKDREAVLTVHRDGIMKLRERIELQKKK